jgi:hypothetical protein
MGPGDPLPVQDLRDRLGRAAGGVLREDPPHDGGLGRLDPAQAALRDTVAAGRPRDDRVAVAPAAAGSPPLHPAAQAAMGLQGQIAQEQRVHRALKAHVQLADLALGHGHQPDAGEGQQLEQARRVLLVAAQPVQPLRHHHLEPPAAYVLEQAPVAGAQCRGAAQGVVGVDLGHLPALPLDEPAAQPHLVLDAHRALRVRAVARVDRHPYHRLRRRWGVSPSTTSW